MGEREGGAELCPVSPLTVLLYPEYSTLGRKVVIPLICLHFERRLEKMASGFTNLKSAVESKRTSLIPVWRLERLPGGGGF